MLANALMSTGNFELFGIFEQKRGAVPFHGTIRKFSDLQIRIHFKTHPLEFSCFVESAYECAEIVECHFFTPIMMRSG